MEATMEDKQNKKATAKRKFLKTVGATALGIRVFTLPATHTVLRSARADQSGKHGARTISCKKLDIRQRQLKKVPFYSHISTDQIQLYQSYINRAFELSPTLEFEENYHLLEKLLAEAVTRSSLSDLDLELMRLQYVYADKSQREKYRGSWVKKVINHRDTDFFPDPWAIISAIFPTNGRK
jgi:Cdc6-like AAA superfamily ATPase